VEWLDPTTHLSEYIEKVLEKPFSVHRNNGKLVHVGRDVLILEHDKCELEGDYTTVFIGLVAGIKKL